MSFPCSCQHSPTFYHIFLFFCHCSPPCRHGRFTSRLFGAPFGTFFFTSYFSIKLSIVAVRYTCSATSAGSGKKLPCLPNRVTKKVPPSRSKPSRSVTYRLLSELSPLLSGRPHCWASQRVSS